MKKAGDWWVPDHMKSAGNHVRRYGSAVAALKHFPEDRRGICVQAGAHIGTWVRPLSQIFEQVHCWEPMWENMECLIPNCGDIPNVFMTQGCLGDKNDDDVRMHYSKKNTGKHCVSRGGDAEHKTHMQKLDDYFIEMELPNIDALFLDVEGYELQTLMGAHALIHNHKPLILCEENGLSRRYHIAANAIQKYLASLGYSIAESWGEDVIYKHKDWS